jgi:hypothetical protein
MIILNEEVGVVYLSLQLPMKTLVQLSLLSTERTTSYYFHFCLNVLKVGYNNENHTSRDNVQRYI